MGWQRQAIWKRYLDQVRQRLAEEGWILQGVAGALGSSPVFYTVGLTDAGLPELYISIDPDAECVEPYESAMAELVKRHLGGDLVPGVTYTTAGLGQVSVTLMEPVKTRIKLGVCKQLFGDKLHPALEVVCAPARTTSNG